MDAAATTPLRTKIVILIAHRHRMGFWCGEGGGGGKRLRDNTVASAWGGAVCWTTVGVKGVCLLSVAVNDDNRVIVKRFSGMRLNTRVYASRAFVTY